jgi:hypothetical protein
LALREKICDISPFGAARARFDAQGKRLRVLLPNYLRELTVFGAEAQQLFCESFHVTVKFKRKRRKTAAFSASAGLPAVARRLRRAPLPGVLF